MIRDYIAKGMEKAHYEILPEDGMYYGEISECPGVYATGESLEECRRDLEETLEEWLLLRVHKNLSIPRINNIGIVISKEDVA